MSYKEAQALIDAETGDMDPRRMNRRDKRAQRLARKQQDKQRTEG